MKEKTGSLTSNDDALFEYLHSIDAQIPDLFEYRSCQYPQRWEEYPIEGTVPFNSDAAPENRILGNHCECIVTFRGIEFYGFEQLYSSMKFSEHPEVLDKIMTTNNGLVAKRRSHYYSWRGKGPSLYDSDYNEKHDDLFALCQLFKYLSIKEYSNRLRTLRDKLIVEISGSRGHSKPSQAECRINEAAGIYEGKNLSGKTTMAVRDIMLRFEDAAIEWQEEKAGRALTDAEREHAYSCVAKHVRQHYETHPLVKKYSDTIIEYIRNSKKITAERDRTDFEIDTNRKVLLLDFDSCLFDTSADDALRKTRGKKDWNAIYTLIPSYRLYEGWETTLQWARGNGFLIGILCNAQRELVKRAMAHFQLPCDIIVGYKPYDTPVKKACRALRTLKVSDSQVLYVGASIKSQDYAAAATLPYLHAVWALPQSAAQSEDIRVIHSPEEIIHALQSE